MTTGQKGVSLLINTGLLTCRSYSPAPVALTPPRPDLNPEDTGLRPATKPHNRLSFLRRKLIPLPPLGGRNVGRVVFLAIQRPALHAP